MELTHDFTVPATVDDAWATFMDLERVGSCFPGATVTSVDESGFAGTVKVKLGPIALQYAGTGQFLERDDAAHRAVIEAKGKDKRGNGTAGATVTVQLAPSGEGTRIDVTTDLSITGKPAQFGRGVMQDVSDKLLQQFVQCIEGQFAAAEPEPEAADAGAAAPAAAGGPGAADGGGAGRRRCPAGLGAGGAATVALGTAAARGRLDRPRRHGAAGAGQELRAVRRGGARRAGARLADRPPRLLSRPLFAASAETAAWATTSALTAGFGSAVRGAVEGVDLVGDPPAVGVVTGSRSRWCGPRARAARAGWCAP